MATLTAGPEWLVGARDRLAESALQLELGVPSLVAALLVRRGFSDPREAERFLRPNLDEMGSPTLLPDYEPARNAILGSKERGELIFIHGDYDVDGVTSAAIFHRFLNRIGCKVHTHVPHRMKEGYGISDDAVSRAQAMGAKLFLTCDCGIGAHEQVMAAKSFGMTVVVTDHHQIAGEMPEAQAVVNCHRSDSQYPFTELSGAGVVFRLCEGIARELGHPVAKYRRAFLDLAALGTIADMMPLCGENRAIAKFGLEQLRVTNKVGLVSLMREAQVGQDPEKPIRAKHVGWSLGPRLNAVGRIEDAATALELLIENEKGAADELARQLESANAERRNMTLQIAKEAEAMVEAAGQEQQRIILVASADWHRGIVGIAAGRLVERYNRPCIVLTIDTDTGMCQGSARSIPSFHLAEAIWSHPDLMSGGGHAMAAGCSFPLDRLEEVRAALESYAATRLSLDDMRPTVSVDIEVEHGEATAIAADKMADLEPFGCGNLEPLFLARSVRLLDIKPTRNPAHVRLSLQHQTDPPAGGIAFGIGESITEIGVGARVDVLFRLEMNEFRGSRELQWQVKSVVPSAV